MAVDYMMGHLDFDFEHVHKLPPSPPYYSYDNRKRQRISNFDLDPSIVGNFDFSLPQPSPPYDPEFDFTPAFISHSIEQDPDFIPFPASSNVSEYSAPSIYDCTQDGVTGGAPPAYPDSLDFEVSGSTAWMSPTIPAHLPDQSLAPFPVYPDSITFDPATSSASAVEQFPVLRSPSYLNSSNHVRSRSMRAESLISNASSLRSHAHSRASRSGSPNNDEMSKWGYKNTRGSWSCSYPGCTSRSTFTRGCDLRKHYKRHTKTLFCRMDGCTQATEGGFSSKKDRARHEAKHNPDIVCEWDGCDRLFSRVDNMKDHMRRMHKHKA